MLITWRVVVFLLCVPGDHGLVLSSVGQRCPASWVDSPAVSDLCFSGLRAFDDRKNEEKCMKHTLIHKSSDVICCIEGMIPNCIYIDYNEPLNNQYFMVHVRKSFFFFRGSYVVCCCIF